MNAAMTTERDRDLAIAQIRATLKRRTGRLWSVRGGRGTSWGWIRVSAPSDRIIDGRHSDEDVSALAEIFEEPATNFRNANGFAISPPERRAVVLRISFDRIKLIADPANCNR